MRSILCLIVAGGFVLTSCAANTDDDQESVEQHESSLSGAARRGRAARIRDVAKQRGLTNGVLLAGIAQVETGLSHCWSEATWACQGPRSNFCNGPVIAGSADGPCSAQQGGLGMFQFDGGTYQQTLNRDGVAILELDGNVSRAVEFVANMIKKELGLASNAEALNWINSIPVANGNAKFERWKAILACRYNGRCGSAMQANKYGNATIDLKNEFEAGFWPTGTCVVNPDGRLYCANRVAPLRAQPNAGAAVVNTLRTTYSWFDCWGTGEAHGGGNSTWYHTIGDDNGNAGWLPAEVVETSDGFDANPSAHGLKRCGAVADE